MDIETLREKLELLEDNYEAFKKDASERIKRLELAAKKVVTQKIDDVSKANTIFLKHKYDCFSAVNQISDTRYRITIYGTGAKMLKHAASRTKDNMVSYVVLGNKEIVVRAMGENKKKYRASAESLSSDIHAKFDFTSMYCPVDYGASYGQFILRIDLGARIDPKTMEVLLI